MEAPLDGPLELSRDFSLELALAELAGRLAADRAALTAEVAGLTQSQADWRPAPDRWSIGEVLHHLILANRQYALQVKLLVRRGRKEGRLIAPPDARRSWPRLRRIADASRSGPVTNPAPSTPTHGLPLDKLLADLAASHDSVAGQIPDLASLDLASLTAPHPLGFVLNLYQWVDIAGAHERRHLAQIRAIRSLEAGRT